MKQNLLTREVLEAQESMGLHRISTNNRRDFPTKWSRWVLLHVSSYRQNLSLNNRLKTSRAPCQVQVASKSSAMVTPSNRIQKDKPQQWYPHLIVFSEAQLSMMTKTKKKTIIREQVAGIKLINSRVTVLGTTRKLFNSRIPTTINSSSKIRRKKKTWAPSSSICKEWIYLRQSSKRPRSIRVLQTKN